MNKRLIVIGIGIVSVLLLFLGLSIYPDWLWFENLGFSPVFWTMLMSKFGFGLMVWLLLTLIVGINVYVANRLNPSSGAGGNSKIVDDYISQLGLSPMTVITLAIALIIFLNFYTDSLDYA